MLRVPKSAYTLATSSIRKIMAPTSKTAAVSRLLPVTQQDEITEDYCRDDMAIFGVIRFFEVVCASPVAELGFRLRVLSFVFLNVSSSLDRGSSDPCSPTAMKTTNVRPPCLI